MNLNPIWKMVASVVVVVSLTLTQLEPAAFAQAPTVEKVEKTAQPLKAVQQEEAMAPANRIAMASPPAGAAPQSRPAAVTKSKKKWWVLIGIGAAAVLATVLITRRNSGPTAGLGGDLEIIPPTSN